MTSKERVMRTFAREQADRVPVDYLANSGIDHRLKRHFRLADDDNEGLRRALNVDFRRFFPGYVGPRLHEPVPDRQIALWGARKRWVEHASGGYWDFCDWPLAHATLEEIETWPMPSPDAFDYDGTIERIAAHAEYFIALGHGGVGDIINSTGMVRTMEQTLVDMMTGAPESEAFYRRKTDVQLEVLRRTLEKANGAVDMIWMGEDLGTQTGPLISLELYRSAIRPIHQKFVDLGKAYGIPVMIHCCGSSSWAFEDFIEMGIGVVDTLQPEAANMAPAYLKETYGHRLCFHGMISTAGPVATGSPEDTREDVRETLAVMKPGGGYALAPTHQLQDNSPTENVVAMYEEALRAGSY